MREEDAGGGLRPLATGSLVLSPRRGTGIAGRSVHGFPIHQSKVQRPQVRPATLHRGRLVRWIEEHVGRRVLFITAEAGYGKTTLLADWAQRSTARVAWLRLDEDDATWVKC